MFNLFGSASSRDYDILVFVDQLGTIFQNKETVKEWESKLQLQFPDKPLNVNLGVVVDSRLTQVFKGTVDEVNNSVMDTYDLHEQLHPRLIQLRLERDVDLKIIRGLRIMLSMLSRTQYRQTVKKALSGEVTLKYQTLQMIDFSLITDLGPGKNMTWPDYYKTMSFQMGQMFGLLEGIELYTKEDIAKTYPELNDMLHRLSHSPAVLESFKQKLLQRIEPSKLKYQTETHRK